MIAAAIAFLAGAVFALGLGISGMTRPAKVIGFLDVAGDWDPSLALVMIGAIAVHAPLGRLVRRRRGPLLGGRFVLPTRRDVDLALVLGATLFGVGWGVAGYCPGPAVVSLVSGKPAVVIFLGAMLGGMVIHMIAFERPGTQARPGERRSGRASDAAVMTAGT